jgi:hypothetical protein
MKETAKAQESKEETNAKRCNRRVPLWRLPFADSSSRVSCGIRLIASSLQKDVNIDRGNQED